MPSPRPASTRQARAVLEYALGTVARTNPITAAWRWRYELAGAAGLAVAWLALDTAVAAGLTGELAAALSLTACFTRGRRFLSRAHVVHRDAASRPRRLRPRMDSLPLRQAPLHPADQEPAFRRARLPLVPGGASAADFSSARKLLAAACWAKEVQVGQHARYAHLVALDVIRREPPAQWGGQPWYDTGTPDRSLSIPAPREPADDQFWIGEPPHDESPRWLSG